MPQKQTAKKRIKELINQIKHHDNLYYIKQSPQISDTEYDNLLKELKEIEATYPEFILKDSPTQKVSGGLSEGFSKVVHKVPLLSLDSLFNPEDIENFDKRVKKDLNQSDITYTCEFKFDGVSVSLTYENGIFTQGGTRGDGKTGEDITNNLKNNKKFTTKTKS